MNGPHIALNNAILHVNSVEAQVEALAEEAGSPLSIQEHLLMAVAYALIAQVSIDDRFAPLEEEAPSPVFSDEEVDIVRRFIAHCGLGVDEVLD